MVVTYESLVRKDWKEASKNALMLHRQAREKGEQFEIVHEVPSMDDDWKILATCVLQYADKASLCCGPWTKVIKDRSDAANPHLWVCNYSDLEAFYASDEKPDCI